MTSQQADHNTRLSFQETMDLVELPASGENNNRSVVRYMGTRAAWLPGSDLSVSVQSIRAGGKPVVSAHKAAFGGQVYAQAALSMCRALQDSQKQKGAKATTKLGLHVS
jgi:hypothetical protein